MNVVKRFIVSVLVLSMLPVSAVAAAEEEKKTIDIALITDSHVFKNDLLNGSSSLNELIKAETRLVLESEAVLDKALSDITAMEPDVLLHCGDLTSNGEHVCMELIKD